MTNGIELASNQEIKRRTRVARMFPNEASCLRLVNEKVMDISDEWEGEWAKPRGSGPGGRAYLTFES